MTTFLKGLGWVVAFLAGLATIFALFGGQQWLQERGWSLAPGPEAGPGAIEQTESSPEPTGDAEPTEDMESTGDPESTGGTGPTGETAREPEESASVWAGMTAWSEDFFGNVLWGIAAVGVAMLVAGAAGSLAAHAFAPLSAVSGFFQWLLAAVCVAAVVCLGVLLHAADPGYLVWYIVLTAISVPVGFLIPIFADGG